jgi:hypothetical protein
MYRRDTCSHVDRSGATVSDSTLQDFVCLREVPDRLPKRNGRKLGLATIYRWAKDGCQGVRLATWQLGGCRYTTPAALEQFVADLTAARGGHGHGPVVAPAARQAAVARQLDELGI